MDKPGISWRAEWLFFALLLAGNAILSDLPTSLLVAALIFIFWLVVRPWIPRLRLGSGGRIDELILSSLLGLGTFPFFWMLAVLIFSKRYPFLLFPLLLFALALSFRKKTDVRGKGSSSLSLVLLFLVTILLMIFPYSKIGSLTDHSFAYRAYFSSDYLKHFSIVETLNRAHLPPANPYFAGESLHYYWLPYTFPATVARVTGSTEKALFAWSFTVNILFLLLLWRLIRTLFPRGRWLSLGIALLGFFCSLEGLYFFITRAGFRLGTFFQAGREMNIDALTRWVFNLPQVDSLLRTFLYTPQHLMGLCFLLLFLGGLPETKENPLFRSFVLSLAFLSSFFIGGILLLAWFLFFFGRNVFDLIQRRFSLRRFLDSIGAGFFLPVLAVGLALWLRMFAPSSSGISWAPLTPVQFAITFGLNFGLLLITGIWGFIKREDEARAFGVVLLLLSIFFIAFLRIQHFESDISLKAGLIVIVLLVLLTAAFFEYGLGKTGRPAVLALLLLAGLPTAVLDLRNSSDIANGRFTTYIPADEMNLLRWMRENIPADAVVQDYPPAREWNLSIIPSFAGRGMSAADQMHGDIFQVGRQRYASRIDELAEALRRLPQDDSRLRHLGIHYLFWGEPERRFFGFSPNLEVVKKSGQAVLYRVQ